MFLYNDNYILFVMHKKRVVCLIIILVMLLTVILPASITASDGSNSKAISSGQYGKGYRYNIQGFVYLHLEGDPYERGFQQGYLASEEIVEMIHRWGEHGSNNVKMFKLFKIKDPERFWEICKSRTMRVYEELYPDEYREEIRGIADGAKARGAQVYGHDIEYEDIMTLNQYQECWWYYIMFWKQFHPLRNIFNGIKSLLPGGRESEPEGFCSAFIATGDATSDGSIVAAHSIAPMPNNFMERANFILDVQPTDGYRFIMTSPPGYIWSNENYYQNEKGIVIFETVLPQGPWKRKGTPISIRSRNAIQYSDSIDDALDALLDGNKGFYTTEWLIGDTETGEIASLELALYNTPIKRTKNGFLWSCNVPHDPKVQKETLGLIGGIPFFMQLFPFFSENEIAIKFEELKKEYYGKIDIHVAKTIMETYPICKKRADCKITDTKLMEDLGLLVHMGNPNGSEWIPDDEFKKKFEILTGLPASGWTEIFPLNSDPTFMKSTEVINYKGKNSKILWQYETDDTRNRIYSSSLIDEDVVYTVTSSGTIYALDRDNGRQKWSKEIGDKSVDLEMSEELIFIGTDEGLSSVFKDSGKIKWEQSVGEISSKPVIVDDQIIASNVYGELYGFDLNTGEKKWMDIFDGMVYISEAKGDTIYLGSGKTCYAYDVIDNEVIWRFHTLGPITASPKVNGDTVYVGSWGGNICALDSETGVKKWCYETGWGIDSTPDIKDGTVYVGSLDNNFYALDEENGDLKWFFTCKSAIHSNPVAYGDYVFFGCDDGRFYALNKTTGKLAWNFAPGYFISDDTKNYITTPILSNPTVEEGVVYFGAKGNVYALDAQTFEKPVEPVDDEIEINMVIIALLAIIIVVALILVYSQFKKKKGGKK